MAVVKKSMSSIAVLISGNGSNLQAIIDAVISGQLNADINVVISDQPDAYGLQRAKQAGLPCVVCEPQKGMTREQYDAMLQDVLQRYEVDLVVLSGFMRIVSPSIVQYFWGRMINIHPSLLPKYPGLGTHQKVLAEGEKEHGCCVHFVTEELDAGPVMAYAQLQVLPEDTAETQPPKQAYNTALKAYNIAKSRGYTFKKPLITLVDFSLPSSQKRLWVIDTKTNTVLLNLYVTHGKNSGKLYAKYFSDQPGSHESSLGAYTTTDSFYGPNGYSLTINGIDKGYVISVVQQSPYGMGQYAVGALNDNFNGKMSPRVVDVPITLVNKSNVGQFK